jgi:hypothetical protein
MVTALHRRKVHLAPVQGVPTGNNNGCSGRIACGGGKGRLELIDERPDPIFGVLGMSCQTLKCDFLECGKLTIV